MPTAMTEPTTTTATTATSRFAALYHAARASRFSEEPGATLARRDAAMARFSELGVPTRHDEEWKETNLADLDLIEFTLDESRRAVDPASIEPLIVGGGALLVFVNGRFDADLSRLGGSPAGMTFRQGPLADAPVLDRCTELSALPFAHLNEALSPSSAVVRIARGVRADEPVQVLFIAAAVDTAIASFPRLRVIAEEDAEAVIVETHVTLGAASTIVAGLTEIDASAGACVTHERTAELNEHSRHFAAITIRQGRDSRVDSAAIAVGGGVTRHDFRASLDGPGADCTLRGLAMLAHDEHVDNHLLVRHAAPGCTSREFFKNILDGSSHGVFCGRIHVDQDAQKTDGVQTNSSLLLSEEARATSRPQLEIYADDVKCTHGATVGQLDENAIFYLRSRGLPEPAARAMLVHGFAGEILDALRVEPLRERLKDRLFGRAPTALD